MLFWQHCSKSQMRSLGTWGHQQTCFWLNTLRPRQNGRHFADNIFKCMFLNENVWIPIKVSLKFIPKGPINNISALVQTMAWRRSGDKPLSEPMMVRLPTHIYASLGLNELWGHIHLPLEWVPTNLSIQEWNKLQIYLYVSIYQFSTQWVKILLPPDMQPEWLCKWGSLPSSQGGAPITHTASTHRRQGINYL